MPKPTPEQAMIQLYQQAAKSLRIQIRAALERGADGTAAYRAAQLQHVQGVLRQLGRRSRPLQLEVALAPYVRGARAVDFAGGAARASAGFAFGGTHQRAVRVLADNLSVRVEDAVQLVGRRTEDVFRKVALEEVGQVVAAGGERRQASRAIAQRLVNEGVTDALTGFVDARGARWQLDNYAEMVARTTTREAMSAGTANRMRETGQQLVTISAHATSCEICAPYEGNTYALPDSVVEGYDTIDQLPPFHPNCLHVATPADGNAERFLAALGAPLA